LPKQRVVPIGAAGTIATDLHALPIAEQTRVFTAYVRTKAGKITLCAMPRKWREVEKTAANMSKAPDVERVSVAAYGRIIASFKGGVRIDLEFP
jgi:hypothetical protein